MAAFLVRRHGGRHGDGPGRGGRASLAGRAHRDAALGSQRGVGPPAAGLSRRQRRLAVGDWLCVDATGLRVGVVVLGGPLLLQPLLVAVAPEVAVATATAATGLIVGGGGGVVIVR